MKRTISKHWKVALAAGIVTTLGMLPQARAELVYEPEVSANAPVQVRQQDREETRQDLAASVKAQDTVQSIQAQPIQQQSIQQQPASRFVTAQPIQQPLQQQMVAAQPQQVAVPVAVQVQPVATVSPMQVSDSQQQPEVESLSKAELLRRERMRTELQNEDLLDERLEELRLRDEQHRTQQLLGNTSATQDQPSATIPGFTAAASQQPQSEVVVSPVTDRPGQPAPQVAPVPSAAQAQEYAAGQSPYTPAAQDQISASQAAAISTANAANLAPDEGKKKTQFYISPRAGISSLSVNSSLSGVSASGLYSLGLALGVSVSDNVAFEVGYTNAQYGINLGPQYMVPGMTPYTYQLSQNVIDAMLKLYFLGPDSTLRPFVGAGGGYAMSSLNYPNQITSIPTYSYLNNQSYNSNAFLGELSAGMDIKISKSVSVGAMFKYSDVLSSNQNNNNLYYYPGYAGGAGLYGPNAQQALTGASLSQSSFYSAMGTVNFTF